MRGIVGWFITRAGAGQVVGRGIVHFF
jgi:hypothetical protein